MCGHGCGVIGPPTSSRPPDFPSPPVRTYHRLSERTPYQWESRYRAHQSPYDKQLICRGCRHPPSRPPERFQRPRSLHSSSPSPGRSGAEWRRHAGRLSPPMVSLVTAAGSRHRRHRVPPPDGARSIPVPTTDSITRQLHGLDGGRAGTPRGSGADAGRTETDRGGSREQPAEDKRQEQRAADRGRD